MIKYIDTHIHIDSKKFKNCEKALSFISNKLKKNNIEKGIVLHLNWQKWSAEDFLSTCLKFKTLYGFINIDLNKFNEEKLKKLKKNHKLLGIKLHPRFNQSFRFNHKNLNKLCIICAKLKLPILVCSFFDKITLKKKIIHQDFFYLAKNNPKTKFIFAHLGGYKCMDFLVMAKQLDNVYLDLSFSINYFKNSSIKDQLLFCCKSLKCNKIFYGSDYPELDLKKSIDMHEKNFLKNFTKSEKNKIFYKNAKKFFNF